MLFISIEDVVANALIQVMEATPSKKFLTYTEIKQYGINVVRFLRDKGKPAVFLCSRDNMMTMFHNYEEFFEEKEENGNLGIRLRNEKTVKDLIDTFQGYLALDVLFAFLDENVTKIFRGQIAMKQSKTNS